MTLEEACLVAGICSTADGKCPTCVENLRRLLQYEFPEFDWTLDDDYRIEVNYANLGVTSKTD